MELTDPQVIDILLAGLAASRQFPPKSESLLAVARSRVHRSRCSCAKCPQCLDNKRWESIFDAKFADPDYYKERPVRHTSSLDWLR